MGSFLIVMFSLFCSASLFIGIWFTVKSCGCWGGTLFCNEHFGQHLDYLRWKVRQEKLNRCGACGK